MLKMTMDSWRNLFKQWIRITQLISSLALSKDTYMLFGKTHSRMTSNIPIISEILFQIRFSRGQGTMPVGTSVVDLTIKRTWGISPIYTLDLLVSTLRWYSLTRHRQRAYSLNKIVCSGRLCLSTNTPTPFQVHQLRK